MHYLAILAENIYFSSIYNLQSLGYIVLNLGLDFLITMLQNKKCSFFEHLVHVDLGKVIFSIVSAFTFVFTLAYNKPLRSVNATSQSTYVLA